jgi:hypothetical protein
LEVHAYLRLAVAEWVASSSSVRGRLAGCEEADICCDVLEWAEVDVVDVRG